MEKPRARFNGLSWKGVETPFPIRSDPTHVLKHVAMAEQETFLSAMVDLLRKCEVCVVQSRHLDLKFQFDSGSWDFLD